MATLYLVIHFGVAYSFACSSGGYFRSLFYGVYGTMELITATHHANTKTEQK